ncbi:DinB family protein [Parapedobacter lycopersici]|uniref:DinB family protein n=1 Tax=Parapedobacter lycopersici TaxID=1864939 RepID=UPI00333F95D4
MNAFFSELFSYNHHCNQQLAAYIAGHADRVSVRTVQLFSHVLNAQHIWNSRILGEPSDFGVWHTHTPEDFAPLNLRNYRDTQSIIAGRDLDAVIQYATTRGGIFSNTTQDILFHTVNHATYHRGQIATDLRQSGLEPLATDYILYKR